MRASAEVYSPFVDFAVTVVCRAFHHCLQTDNGILGGTKKLTGEQEMEIATGRAWTNLWLVGQEKRLQQFVGQDMDLES